MLANNRLNSLAFAGALLGTSVLCEVASAGPLVDWFLNNRYGNQPATVTANYPIAVAPIAYAVGPYSPTQNATALPTYPTSQYSAGYMPVTQQTLGYLPIPQTTLGVLPTGSYQTTLNKVPTTYYRPVTSLDPNTGTTVTTLQPCTSYQQQVLRTPLIAPTTTPYYAAYGGYGAGLAQDRYSPITGSGIATAPGQSTLSIASTVNSGYTPVNQIPITGTVVSPAPIITSGYTPIVVQPVPAISYSPAPVVTYPNSTTYPTTVPTVVQAPPTYSSNVVAPSNPVGTGYLNSPLPTYPTGTTNPSIGYPNTTYSNAPIQTQSSQYTPSSVQYPGANGGRIVQADGTIITPLGSTMSSVPSQSTAPINQGYSSNTSNYIPQNYNTQPYVGPSSTSVLPNDNLLPQSNSYQGSGNPAINGNYQPQGSGSNPALSSDPASLTPPSLPPLSRNSAAPSTKNVNMIDNSKMVTIDRPSQANFTRNPVENNSVSTANAFVNERDVSTPAYAGSTNAPALLKPRSSDSEQLQGVRPPEGYSPKPYWRSKQQSASPNALYIDQEKTARNTLNPDRTVNVSQLNSGAQVQFVGGDRAANNPSSTVQPAVAIEPSAAPATNTPPAMNTATQGRQLPVNRQMLKDSFRPVRQ